MVRFKVKVECNCGMEYELDGYNIQDGRLCNICGKMLIVDCRSESFVKYNKEVKI